MISTLHSEWTKALTLRSVQGTILAALIVAPALALASGLAFDAALAEARSFPVEAHGFQTAGFGQPLIILLAALITGSEYLGGQLRTTLVATPRRGRVFIAKLVVITALTLVIAVLSTSASVALAHAALGVHGLAMTEFTAGIAWNLVGVAVNYTLMALISAAITVIARTIIVALVTLVPLVLGVTISLVGTIPALRYLPDLAGIQLVTSYPGIGLLDPVTGGMVMAAWAVSLGSVAGIAFHRRDTAG
ncbi:ABC transporter permease [Agromyces atrinae]|uniref:ABC transporter permease n=1 Tax=Agromyces atrinae TaxID=592376 RepID=UPI001F56FE6E|nr:ABC transporter permease [Agromyces atrinae]MCI2958728.1 ABC transporter permease [Agromyces atrinae]